MPGTGSEPPEREHPAELLMVADFHNGIRNLLGAGDPPQRDALQRALDRIRLDLIYQTSGSVFSGLESIAHAVRNSSSERADQRSAAVLTGGSLAFVALWVALDADIPDLLEDVAKAHGLWAPDEISDDITWAHEAQHLGHEVWEEDAQLRQIVGNYAGLLVEDSELALCQDAAGFVKLSVTVAITDLSMRFGNVSDSLWQFEQGSG